MVYKMATVGYSSVESKEMGDNCGSKLSLMCKKNGVNTSCCCEERLDRKIPGRSHLLDKFKNLNGSVKTNNNNSFSKPSIPTLRSRRERHSSGPDFSKRRRRSSRHENGDAVSEGCPDTGQNVVPKTDLECLEVAAITCNVTTPIINCNNGPHSTEMKPLIPLVSSIRSNSSGSDSSNCSNTSCNNSSSNNNNNNNNNSSSSVGDGGGIVVRGSDELLNPVMSPDLSRSCTPLFLNPCPRVSPSQSPASSGVQSPWDKERCLERESSTPGTCTPVPVQAMCMWQDCDKTLDSGEVMEHIRTCHVVPQYKNETFVCLWKGCKVFDRTSCSKSWLDRHILSHSGDKPFRCIVAGCGARFTSQKGLERHVNSHFTAQEQQTPNHKNLKQGREDTPTKLFKRKRLKQRGRHIGVKTTDYFDTGIMEALQLQLNAITEKTQIDLNGSNNSVTFHSNVIARRTEESGKVRVLLHWTPEDILPDDWVLESQVAALQTCSIPINSLPPDYVLNLHPSLYNQHRYRKHRRK